MLTIEIKVRPHPKTLPVEEFNTLMDGELAKFEAEFMRRQGERGLQPQALMNIERAILKAYVFYMAGNSAESA